MIHDKWQATNAWTIHAQFAGPVTGAQEGVIEGYTGLTQILSDRTLSHTCMPIQMSPAPVHQNIILGVTKYVSLFLRSIIIKALQGIEVRGNMALKTGNNPLRKHQHM